jgi:DNA-binding MarR family transcriptional regulator
MEAWRGFLEVGTMLNRRIEQQLQDDSGLSHSQYEVLVRLAGAPGGKLRMTELAGISKTSKSGLTYQVTQLERAGLVRRVATSDDDRGVLAVLTPTGRRLLDSAAPVHVALVRDLFLDGLTPEQFAGLADGLHALRRHLLDNA